MSAEQNPGTQPQEIHESFVARNAGMIQFFLVTAAIFTAAYFLYQYVLVGSELLQSYIKACAEMASQLLSLFGIENSVVHMGRLADATAGSKIEEATTGAGFIIDSSSDASLSFFLLVAGILAWPGAWLKKLVVLLFGVVFIVALNVLRLCAMLLVDLHLPLQFNLYNDTILPTLLIFAALAYFLFWVKVSGSHPADRK